MKRHSTSAGFAHYLALLTLLVLAGIGGAFTLVVRAHNQHAAVSLKNGSDPSLASQNNTAVPTADKLYSVPSTSAMTQNTSPPPSSKSSASSSTATTTPKSTTATTPTSNSNPSPEQTPIATSSPLGVLASLIDSIQNGTQGQVTTSSVAVAGPVSTAHARPLVFTAQGKTYYAYTQGVKPNFNQDALKLAQSMAITPLSGTKPALTYAHLDKSGNLVDSNFALVGYSTGGN